jgi:hypothetical protein
MLASGTYHNEIKELLPGVWTLRTVPSFGIGQRAFLIKDQTDGLVMWDCIAFLDDATLAFINYQSEGKGLRAMVVSHPH